MNGSFLLWGILALTVSWGVGVYQRLMRMQARGLAALRSVEKHMHRCAKLIDLHASYLADQSTSDPFHTAAVMASAWTQLVEAMRQLDVALKDAKGTPLANQSVVAVGGAFEAVQIAWQQWCSVQLASDAVLIPAATREQWDGATLKAQAARAGLNQILSTYNQAIHQFPARMVVGFMGFKSAELM